MAPLSIPSPPLEWSSFSLGPLTVHTYALVIVIGIIVALLWTNRRLVRRGGEPWVVIDIVIWAVPLGLVGARFYHVFTHSADYFYDGAELWRVFAIWEGGNAIIGALIGGAIGAFIGCRFAGIRFLSFADAVAPPLLLAQAIGRVGNWFNHELFGWPTDLPWGLEIEPTNPAWPEGLPPGTLFHPTFLYELLWSLLGVGVLVLLERMFRMRWGKTLAVYFIWYGVGRMVIESIRVDYSEIVLGLRSNVFGALCLVVIGVVLFVVQTRRHHEPEESIYLPGRAPGPVEGDAAPAEGADTAESGSSDDSEAQSDADDVDVQAESGQDSPSHDPGSSAPATKSS